MKINFSFSLLIIIAMLFSAIVAYGAADSGTMMLAPGDEVYACACGDGCDCKTMSRNPGKCTCGNDLVKSNVLEADKGMVILDVNNKKDTFPTTGKYTCACGPTCDCGTISQNPGKCTCGKPMAPVK